MAYSNGSGPSEGAMLVLARNLKEAKKLAWPVFNDWSYDAEYTDLYVRRLRNNHVLALADKEKLLANAEHVVECPIICDSCEFWGNGVDENGNCLSCGEYAGDLLVKLYANKGVSGSE
jgi:hypothetical protein